MICTISDIDALIQLLQLNGKRMVKISTYVFLTKNFE